jgi:hypothetical protein
VGWNIPHISDLDSETKVVTHSRYPFSDPPSQKQKRKIKARNETREKKEKKIREKKNELIYVYTED